MDLAERIAAFSRLGDRLRTMDGDERISLFQRARNENAWFTEESVALAVESWATLLTHDRLARWVSPYSIQEGPGQEVAIVMAGNIPLVGFHDLLSVLISGNVAQVKLSSKDMALPRFMIDQLVSISPAFADRIRVVEQLKGFHAVIATGSDNSARYFEHYFGKYPHIIRKNRTSCAVIAGKESNQQIEALGKDVFSYFGLGCRNVSKIFVPREFDVTRLFDGWKRYQNVIHHHKYHNNYDYQKSILLVNRSTFLDNGFLLLEESSKLVSPISVLYYETYGDEGELAVKLFENHEKIQCVVGEATADSIPFGKAQAPELWDYADRVDTLKFLEGLGVNA